MKSNNHTVNDHTSDYIIGLLTLIAIFKINTIDGIFCTDQYHCCLTTEVHYESDVIAAQSYCEDYGTRKDEFQLIEIRDENDTRSMDAFLRSNIQFNNSKLLLNGILMESERWFWITSPKQYSDCYVAMDNKYDSFAYIDLKATFRSSDSHTARGFVCQSTRSEDGCQIKYEHWTSFVLMPDAESCFYFVSKPKLTWFHARMECFKLQNSDMADFESSVLQRQMLFWANQNSVGKNVGRGVTFWVGLVKDRWVWSGGPDDFDGVDMNMTNWKEGYPIRTNEMQKCLYMEVDHVYNKWKNGLCQSTTQDYYSVACVSRDFKRQLTTSRNETFSTNAFKTTFKIIEYSETGSVYHVSSGIIAAIASSAILFAIALLILIAVIFRCKCKRFLKKHDRRRSDDSTFTFHRPQVFYNPFNQQITFQAPIDDTSAGNVKNGGSIFPDVLPSVMINTISDDYSNIGESHFGSFRSASAGNNVDPVVHNRTIENEFVYENEEFFDSIINDNQNFDDKISVGHIRVPNGDTYALVKKK